MGNKIFILKPINVKVMIKSSVHIMYNITIKKLDTRILKNIFVDSIILLLSY